MQRAEVVSLFAELRTTEPVIVGPGSTSGALYQADHRSPTIYNMDMGYAAAICLGLALAAPAERVVALEGDGSTLAGLGVLSTIGRYRPPAIRPLLRPFPTYRRDAMAHGLSSSWRERMALNSEAKASSRPA